MGNTVIQLRKSSVPSAKPFSLEFGELAINYADGKIYYKNTNSQIAEISGAVINSFGTVNANNVLVVADTPGDILSLESGQNITIVGDAINDKITISAPNVLANATGTFAGSLTITEDLITRGNVTLGDASTDTITLNGSTISLGNNQSIDSGTLFVDATNNRVGIGTTAPTSSLHLSYSGADGSSILFIDGSNSSISANPAFLVRVPSTGDQKAFQLSKGADAFAWASFEYNAGGSGMPGFALGSGGSGRDTAIYRHSTNTLAFSTGGIQRLTVNVSNVGIGITNPTSLLHVNGAANIVTNLTVGGNVTFDNINSVRLSEPAANVLTVHTASTERLRVDANGNIGIGTSAPSYRLEVAGSFAAQTKSFVIDHHTKPYSKLVHGSLEGPENGVYYRGKSKKKTIELPDYWSWLVDEETITVNLTPIGKKQDLFVKEIKDNKVIIGGARTVEYYYTVYAERKDVPKLIVEC